MAGLTLHLWRHAKAAKGDATIADFDRPLTSGGSRGASEIAELIAARADRPSRILCSTSQRTRETLAPLLLALAADTSVDLTRRIYEASAETLLQLIQTEASESTSLILIGHNPGLETLARWLAGSGDDHALRGLRDGLPPGALAVIHFDAEEWSEIAPGHGRLQALAMPAG